MTAIVFSSLLMACNENPLPDPKPRERHPSKNVTGRFELKNSVLEVLSGSGYVEQQIISEGEGEMSILGPSRMYLNHRSIIDRADNSEFVDDGNLIITSDQGIELHGNFTSHDFMPNGVYQITVKITGGTGELMNAYGELILERPAPPNQEGIFVLELTGIVYVRGNNNFPLIL